jgi:tryptophanyl-tRNA synthetase
MITNTFGSSRSAALAAPIGPDEVDPHPSGRIDDVTTPGSSATSATQTPATQSPATQAPSARRKRMLTGDRPTGKLHLGHFVGSIENRVRLQHEYETFLIIADLHMLTTRNTRKDIDEVSRNARDMVLDQLAAGIDPEHATFYLQSAIPEVCELNTLFQNLVTVPRLERVPSLKDMARAAGKDEMPYGLLGYPVLQAADILCVKGDIVPVGKDNHAHVEVTREIARRFNFLYGEVFPIPELVESQITTLIGTDGQSKMSKSLGNAIMLSDDAATVRRKVIGMYTDPNRVRADIPGTVEGNPVFAYHDAFNDDPAEVADLKERYRAGRVGDVEVKDRLTSAVNRYLEPMRERRAGFERQSGLVDEIIVDGTERTRREVQVVLAEVKRAMGITGSYNQLRRKAERARKRRDA